MDLYGDKPAFLWLTTLVRDAITAQKLLGWYAFLMGCIAKPIVSLQQSYYTAMQSRNKGITWATRLIIKCWNVVYHLWTHRNSILHESQALGSLSGLTLFCIAIAAELATHTRVDVSAPCLLPIFQYNIGDSSSTKTTSTETMVPCHPAWS
jgi:hypothetical protein